MPLLSKLQLLNRVVSALHEGGWQAVVFEARHPFLIRMSGPEVTATLRVYIWNCTPGGNSRADTEFRIQLTGAMPTRDSAADQTLLLGWHSGYGVFAAWDIAAHDAQSSKSPSAQLVEGTLQRAKADALGVQYKDNEVVVAMAPAYLGHYAVACRSLHATDSAAVRDTSLLNSVQTLTDAQISGVRNKERQRVLRSISALYREAGFRDRVLGAYGHQCAFCGVQLALLDAAHIVPVNAPGSTDEVINGVALCKTHHHAYDSNLVSFNENYRIELSQARLGELSGKHGGLASFRKGLRATLLLPANLSDRPDPGYVLSSRKTRGWRR